MKKNPLLKFIKAAESDETDIAKLYNLDVNKKKFRNIIEEAHPDVLVAFDSYDAINGVIENQNQAQDTTINILNRRQHGVLTNEIFTSRANLINSIVKTANTLDFKEPALAIYADNILKQLDKENVKLKSEAFAPLAAVTGVLGVAAPYILIPAGVVGLIWFHQHTDAMDLGFKENITKLIKEIDDIINDRANFVGRTYSKVFTDKLKQCKSNLDKMLKAYSYIKTKISSLSLPKSAEELLKTKDSPEDVEAVQQFGLFKRMSEDMGQYLTQLKNSLSTLDMKEMQIEDKGWLQKMVDSTKILSGGNGLINDDIDDVLALVGPVVDSIKNLNKVIETGNSKSHEVVQAAVSAQAEQKEKAKKSDLDASIEGLTSAMQS